MFRGPVRVPAQWPGHCRRQPDLNTRVEQTTIDQDGLAGNVTAPEFCPPFRRYGRYPAGGVEGGRSIDELTSYVDFMPTIIAELLIGLVVGVIALVIEKFVHAVFAKKTE